MGLRSPYGNGPQDLTGPAPGGPSPAQATQMQDDSQVPMTRLDLPGMELTPGQDPKDIPNQPVQVNPDAMSGTSNVPQGAPGAQAPNPEANPLAAIAAKVAGAVSGDAEASDKVVNIDDLLRQASEEAGVKGGFPAPHAPEVKVKLFSPGSGPDGPGLDLDPGAPSVDLNTDYHKEIPGILKFDPSGTVYFKGDKDKEYKNINDDPTARAGYEALMDHVKTAIEAPGQALGAAGSMIPGGGMLGAAARIGAQVAGPYVSQQGGFGQRFASAIYGDALVNHAMQGYNNMSALKSGALPAAVQAGAEAVSGPFAAILGSRLKAAETITPELNALKDVGQQAAKEASGVGIDITPGMAVEGQAPSVIQTERALLKDPVVGPQMRQRVQETANQTQAALDDVRQKFWQGLDPKDMSIKNVTISNDGRLMGPIERAIDHYGKQVQTTTEIAGNTLGKNRRIFDPTAVLALADSQLARMAPEAVLPNGSISSQALSDAVGKYPVDDQLGYKRLIQQYLSLKNKAQPEAGALAKARAAIPTPDQYAIYAKQNGMQPSMEAYNEFVGKMVGRQSALTPYASTGTSRNLTFDEMNAFIKRFREEANFGARQGATLKTEPEKAAAQISSSMDAYFTDMVGTTLQRDGHPELAQKFVKTQNDFNQRIGSLRRAQDQFSAAKDDIARVFNKIDSRDFSVVLNSLPPREQAELAGIAIDNLVSGTVDVGLGGQRVGMSGGQILKKAMQDKTSAANLETLLGREDLDKLITITKITDSLAKNFSSNSVKLEDAGIKKSMGMLGQMFRKISPAKMLDIAQHLFPNANPDLQAMAMESISQAIARREDMVRGASKSLSAVRMGSWINRGAQIPSLGMSAKEITEDAFHLNKKRNKPRMEVR